LPWLGNRHPAAKQPERLANPLNRKDDNDLSKWILCVLYALCGKSHYALDAKAQGNHPRAPPTRQAAVK